jgi:hypothetical protein
LKSGTSLNFLHKTNAFFKIKIGLSVKYRIFTKKGLVIWAARRVAPSLCSGARYSLGPRCGLAFGHPSAALPQQGFNPKIS